MRAFLPLTVALLALAWAHASPAREVARIVSNDASYVVEYALDPAAAPLNERFAADVRVLLGPDGSEPAGDVELAVDARMPHHRHGMRVEPSVTRVAAGTWRVEGFLFHMPGRWELYFDVTRGAVTERAQAVVELE